MQIFMTSDLHLCHDKDFVYAVRGFSNIEDMNAAIVKNWNEVVTPEDEVYVLGDIMLKDNEKGIELISQLKGKIHLIIGNHDTNTRLKVLQELSNIDILGYATIIKYKKYRFYLSHYPTLTGNVGVESLYQTTLNLFGHTHQKDIYFPYHYEMYHVGVDSNNLTPVPIDTILEAIKKNFYDNYLNATTI